jgi:hypothetical protein
MASVAVTVLVVAILAIALMVRRGADRAVSFSSSKQVHRVEVSRELRRGALVERFAIAR